MSDDTATLVHLSVDGSEEELQEFSDHLRNNPLDGYEFMVTTPNADSKAVYDVEEFVGLLADEVADRLEGESDD